LVEYYKRYITPQGARLAVVGSFDEALLKQLLENTVGKWLGPQVTDLKFPILSRTSAHEINYPINRDQVVLAFAGLSVARKDPDYDRLLLFDQEFGDGVLGTANSLLFNIQIFIRTLKRL
jgi:predicted Zn-dependent peptidase